MLNAFPELLVYGFFAPTLLRVAAAVIFLCVVHHQWHHKEALADVRWPIIGSSLGMSLVWSALLIEFGIAALLLVGLYTQPAAAVGLIVTVKYLYFDRRFPAFLPFSRSTSALLLVVLLSLLATGAGAFAYDLPL